MCYKLAVDDAAGRRDKEIMVSRTFGEEVVPDVELQMRFQAQETFAMRNIAERFHFSLPDISSKFGRLPNR
jgi:hypothetical protein